jgi:DMSO/TMAO reductase YedYZ molybdopterin-dependent catalytic subunit
MTFEESIDRRRFLGTGTLATAAVLAVGADSQFLKATEATKELASDTSQQPHAILTKAEDFYMVARGEPRPHTLKGQSLIDARMTPETWRLEITADPSIDPPLITLPASMERSFTIDQGTAIDLPALMDLGKKCGAKYIKAMQCLNLATPLGQGLWEGVPLRDVLRLCGTLSNVRRIYFWGFHNHDPKQIFKASVTYSQAMETPPGEMPVMLAYKLNGKPIPILRGGPVRMIVPWAHGFKNTKWLNHIFITNDPRIPETYMEGNQNNDPDGGLKTAAYVDRQSIDRFERGSNVRFNGHVMCGGSGVKRVEYWLRSVEGEYKAISDDSPELLQGPWVPCEIAGPPDWSSTLPAGTNAKELIGFDSTTGAPKSWPVKYGFASWTVTLRDLKPGIYEFRARSVDENDFAQPEPRPYRKNGNNAIQARRFEVI